MTHVKLDDYSRLRVLNAIVNSIAALSDIHLTMYSMIEGGELKPRRGG